MPKPSAKKPSASRPNIVRAEDEFQFDSMDILIGVVLLIVIPTVTYIGLDAAGMPVSGVRAATAVDSLAEIERRKQLRKSVPLSTQEFDIQFNWAVALLRERVPEYIDRAKAETDAPTKDNWILAAKQTCGDAKEVFESLLKGVDGNAAFDKDPSYAQNAHSQLQRIEQLEAEIRKYDIFKAVRES
ncbi:MAG: hypothetical protein KDC38_02775 [Planctomycetes bacterium]|nr:hypothetical protein [Planctomycetota bacterium]